MTTPEALGLIRPTGSDLISQGDNAISQNAEAVAALYDSQEEKNGRLANLTRKVLHQLSLPGNTNLRDTELTRHARVPVFLPCKIQTYQIVFKNFNEQFSSHYGELDFVNVFIGKRAKDAFGQYTANFDGPPTNLGVPYPVGGVGGGSRRYMIMNPKYELEANTEYLIAYAYTAATSTLPHRGIGGSYLGVNPLGVGSEAVSMTWSEYVPLDVYLILDAPTTVQTIAYAGSSSETGLNSPYPLRDVWCWHHAAERGALPVMLGQSGATLARWAYSDLYTYSKFETTFAKVDLAVLCAGSNDIYTGTALAELRTKHADFCALVRKYISNNLVFADIFPRLTETAAIKAVRQGFNAYLRGLPSGGLLAFDRASAVSGSNGLLDPVFNSGDGTHLTAAGHAELAASVISGLPRPRFTNYYAMDESLGRVMRVWDYRQGREQIVYSDTSERNVAGLDPNVTGGELRVSRMGNLISWRLWNVTLADPNKGISLPFISDGFNGAGWQRAPAADGAKFVTVTTNSITIGSYTGPVYALLSYRTANPWPTALPGVAVGPGIPS